MRISIDLASVQDTSRVLAASADEYDRTAAALQSGEGLGGVTGSQRYWLFSAVESVAARVRAVAAQHREMAADLLRRCECAEDTVSPVYAGIAVAGAQIAFDRNGDGINDTVAIDQDGDGYFESFALDTQQDGFYDAILISDASGNLRAAAFDNNQDGRVESFLGVVPGGAVWGSDPEGDGTHVFSPLATPSMVQPGATFGPTVMGGFSSYGSSSDTSTFDHTILGSGLTPYGSALDRPSFGGGSLFTGNMGYIPSPALSGMVGSGRGGGSLFASGPDYGKLQPFDEFSNAANIDSDGDGTPNRWDNNFRNPHPEISNSAKIDSDGGGTPNRFDDHLDDPNRG